MKFVWLSFLLLAAAAGQIPETGQTGTVLHFTGGFGKYFRNYPIPPGTLFSAVKSDPARIRQQLLDGSIRMAVTTEPPPDSERWKIVKLAFCAPVLAVHPDNPIRNISAGDARGLLNDNIGSWRSLGGPAARIHLYVKAGAALPRAVMDTRHDHRAAPRTIREFQDYKPGQVKHRVPVSPVRHSSPLRLQTESDAKSFSMLFTDPRGMACFDLTRYDENRVPLLSIDHIPPTLENFKSGSYPLMTTYYLVAPKHPSPTEKALEKYILGNAFALQLYKNGCLPVPHGDKTGKKEKTRF